MKNNLIKFVYEFGFQIFSKHGQQSYNTYWVYYINWQK